MFLTGKWAFLPVKGCSVKRVNPWFFYMLGHELYIFTYPQYHTHLAWQLATKTRGIGALVKNLIEQYPSLQSSRDVATRLLESIGKLQEYDERQNPEGLRHKLPTTGKLDDWDKEATPIIKDIADLAKKLQSALENEVPFLPVYHPSQKLAYSTADLVEQAELSLLESTQHKIDEMTKTDMREAGRCLVFDVSTAAGFHTLRAMERVLNQYTIICNPTYPYKSHDWGELISALHKVQETNAQTEIKDHAKRVHGLFQLIKEDRNLIIHPESVLNIDDALALFNLAQTTITTMAEILPDIPEIETE